MMEANPYLNFDGNCREAFTFYAEVLGGTLEAMFPFSEMPQEEGAEPVADHLIMHACLNLGGNRIMASDACGGNYEAPKGLWVSLHPETPEEAERIFNAFVEGGTVIMPLAETFWATRFGMVNDRFGTPWMVNCAVRDCTAPEE